MKLNQLLFLFLISISTSLTAQVYSDVNITMIPSNNPIPSLGASFGYQLNNLIGVGAFAQSQLGNNYRQNNYNVTKQSGVYYGLELKGTTGTSNNRGWTYTGRVGLGNYKYDSYYEGAEHRVNSYYEAYLGKKINRRFSFGLGWRQSAESTDVFEWGGFSSAGDPVGVFDRVETQVYNDWFLRMAYTLGKPAKPTLKQSKTASFLNRLYLDFFVSKNLRPSSNYYVSSPFDQIEGGVGIKITDDIGIGIGAFISSDINTFIEEDLLPSNGTKPSFIDERYYNYGNQGIIGLGLQLRATPGKWYYKAEIGNVIKVASGNNQYYDDFILIDVAYYYTPVSAKTDGFNPYINLHIGRTLWNAITISAGYTYAPNINYTYSYYEGADEISAKVRYHAPQIKVGFTLD